ncbi:DUF6893 family small protein [Arthrobacter sp. NPDC056886]|jgi:hypothetical protein|nr:hypothetical protein [Arthrobacter sp. ES3-54]
MKGLGIMTVVLLLAAGLAAAVVGLRSIPDIKRYVRISRM